MKSFTATLATLAVAGLATATPIYQLGGGQLRPRQEQQGNNDTESSTETAPVSSDPAIISIPSPVQHTGDVDACQGYQLTSANIIDGGVDGQLQLIGNCTAYGPDYNTLDLKVRFETDDRLRVQIKDSDGRAHVVPTQVDYAIGAWSPISEDGSGGATNETSNLVFDWEENPFSFAISRKDDGAVLFNTSGAALIFEEQYLRLRTSLPENSHIQGLGQHNDNFRSASLDYVYSENGHSLPFVLQSADRDGKLHPYHLGKGRLRSPHIHQPLRRPPRLHQPDHRREPFGIRCLPAQLERNGRQVPRERTIPRVQCAWRDFGSVLFRWAHPSRSFETIRPGDR
jgi:hypothetical protein